ncbi:MAG: N-methyl-L-tryptophan oxidase [Planctomycetota bacterium]
MSYDVAVVGLGSVGSAVLYEIARAGRSVIGIDQADPPHDQGSHHGTVKAYRRCYYEHPDYVPLLDASLACWREVEDAAGEVLLETTGGLYIGAPESELVAGSCMSAQRHNLEHSMFDHAALRDRFPQFELPSTMVGFFEPDAGMVYCERAVRAYRRLAAGGGAEQRINTHVIGWRDDGNDVVVKTDSGEIRAASVVLCAGPWMGSLLHEHGIRIEATRQISSWFAPAGQTMCRPDVMPLWGVEIGTDFYYGFPMHDDAIGMKVGRHRPDARSDINDLDRAIRQGDGDDNAAFVAAHVPAASDRVVAQQVCPYAMSDDAHFIVDRLPASPRVFIIAGMSGHGFKFVSVLGRLVAQHVCDGAIDPSIEFLSLSRFDRRA